VRYRIAHAHPALDGENGDTRTGRRVKRGGHLVGGRTRADEQEVEVGISAAGLQSAVSHDGGGIVPAEEVNGDPRDAALPTRGRVSQFRSG